MIVVGITGGIGSGKSIVAGIFHALGIPVYDADRAARKLYETNAALLKKITEEFGVEILDSKGKLDRKKLASIVFEDENNLKKLNKIVHPLVKKDFKDWKELHHASPYLIKEAAILFESGTDKDCDFVITVLAPEQLRVQRVRQRDNRTIAEIKKVMERQSTDEEKISRSKYVVHNDEHHQVLSQVLVIHEELLSMLKSKIEAGVGEQ